MQNNSPIISLHSPIDKPKSGFMLNLENRSILMPIPPHAIEYVTGPALKCIHVGAMPGANMSLQIDSDNFDAKHENIGGRRLIGVGDSGLCEVVAYMYSCSVIDQYSRVEGEHFEFVSMAKRKPGIVNNTILGQEDDHFSFFVNDAEATSAKLGTCWRTPYKGENAQLSNLKRFPFLTFPTQCIVIVSSKINRLLLCTGSEMRSILASFWLDLKE